MKSYKNILKLLVFSLLLSWTSCSEEFINKPLQPGVQSDVSFRRTVVGLSGTLNTSYGVLAGSQWQQYNLTNLSLGVNRSDDSQIGGEGITDSPEGRNLNDFNIYASNGEFSTFWRTCYNGIHYANAVINSGPGALSVATPEEAILINKYVGEAKCLRAYFYFDLVRQFKNIPLVLTSSLDLLPQTNFILIYDQIEKDCLEAAAALPKANELIPSDKGRMNNGSALAILAKAYLFRASVDAPDKADIWYAKSYETAKQVISSNQFTLLSTYDKIWRTTGDFSTEGIVEAGQPNPEETTSAASYWYGIYTAPRYYYKLGTREKMGTVYGWGHHCPTQDMVNDFEPGDPRLHWSIFFQGDSSIHATLAAKKQEICFDLSKTGYYLRKYTPEYKVVNDINNSLNIKYYRYADLILIGAEAATEVGTASAITDALAWLEMVRARARNTPREPNHQTAWTQIPASTSEKPFIDGTPAQIFTTNQDELRDIIRHERRIELHGEGHRFHDLVRWDGTHGFNWKTRIENAQALTGPNYQIDNTDNSGTARVPHQVVVLDWHKLNGIPPSEIKSGAGLLLQNPGY